MKIFYLNTANKIVKMAIFFNGKPNFSEFEQNNDLVETLSSKIKEFLQKNKTGFKDLSFLAVFKGPGGFTSLRIGIVTINAMAYLLKIPIIEITQNEEKELEDSIKKKIFKKDFKEMVLPFYGKEPNITKPKKS